MIDAGLPGTKDEWPNGVLEALSLFRQGTLFRVSPGFYWGDPANPVHRQTAAYAPEPSGVCEFTEPFPYGMVLTQTCDLSEEDPKAPRFPWVDICPVYPADWVPADRRGHAIRGRIQYLIPVHPAGEEGDWVADLRLRVSAEKGWLAQQPPVSGFEDEESRRKVGELLAWRAERPAFDGRFVKAIQQPLAAELQSIRQRDPDLFESLDQQVAKFAIRTTDHVEMTDLEIHVLLNEPMSDLVSEVMNSLWDTWEAKAREEELNLLPLQIDLLADMSAATYCSLTWVPLRGLSPDA